MIFCERIPVRFSETSKNPSIPCGGVAMATNHEIDRREFLQEAAVVGTGLWLPQARPDSSPGEHEITLGTWPHRIYKENDGVLEPATTESFVFNLLVKER